jgi:hypothetical protein
MEILILINSGMSFNKKSHPGMRFMFSMECILIEEFSSLYTFLFYIQSGPESLLLPKGLMWYRRG